jgi:DNA-binding ferritin-like protein
MALKSLFPDDMMSKASVSNEMTLEGIAGKLTYFHEQLHLTHWQTTSYAEHQALGKLYEYVQDFKDDVIEKLMGYTGKRPAPYKIEPLTNCTGMQCTLDLLSFASQLKSYGEVNKFHDVCNLADALSGEAAKTKYLLTLS